MLIYIRHGHDRSSDYRHDQILTGRGKRAARARAEQLISDYGVPDIIYYSPFQRTRATQKQMLKAVERYKTEHGIIQPTQTVAEPRLGRYFNRRERAAPEVHPKTRKQGGLDHEDRQMFKNRVHEHFNEHRGTDRIVWCITHSLVIIRVAKLTGSPYPRHIEYLDYLLVDN